MAKLNYLAKRVVNMNYKQMFQTINEISKKTNKNKVIMFLDIIYCGFKYQAGYMDYKLFEMYGLNRKQRKTIITRGINNELIKKYNDSNYTKYFHDKIEFNKKFKQYLLRDWMEVTPNNYEEFKKFTSKHSNIVVKPVSECCGKGVELIKVTNRNVKKVYQDLLKTKRYLVEEVAEQCKELKKLHPTSINTLRVVTLNRHVVVAFLRIGNHNNIVDNFNHGGMVVPINVKTGKIEYPAIDKQGNLYEKHPLTNEPIIDFQIPDWGKIKMFVRKVAKEIPEIGYAGWDVSFNKNPYLIEGNEFPGHDVYQLPPHRTNGIGLLPTFKGAMEK